MLTLCLMFILHWHYGAYIEQIRIVKRSNISHTTNEQRRKILESRRRSLKNLTDCDSIG